MKRNVIITIFAGALLVVGFQNCSQTGFQFTDETFGKTGYDEARGPLVVDVAEMIDEEEQAINYDETTSGEVVAVEQPKAVESAPDVVAPIVEQETIVADIEVTNPGDNRGPANVKDREPNQVDRESDEILEAYACGGGAKGMKKVFVCHHPQGNPANKHTLCVGFPAARALLEQGKDAQRNYLGQCLE